MAYYHNVEGQEAFLVEIDETEAVFQRQGVKRIVFIDGAENRHFGLFLHPVALEGHGPVAHKHLLGTRADAEQHV